MQLPAESESVLKDMLMIAQDAWTKAILKRHMNTDTERLILRIQLRTCRLLMSLPLPTREAAEIAGLQRHTQARLISLGSEM